MAQLSSIVQYFDALLKPELFQDAALNGLQVEAQNNVVRKVAIAVDSGLSVIEEATHQDADLLIVHHGLFWGKVEPISGVLGQKIALLLKHKCSLYASHLPLDSHAEVGNAFEFGRFLGLEQLEGFAEYGGMTVGAKGLCPKAQKLEYFKEKCSELSADSSQICLPFGSEQIKTVGIVTGSGSFAINLYESEGLDLLISGEAKHQVYHEAKELKANAIFAGHYASETFGVKALGKRLEEEFDLETFYIDQPTGI